MSGHQNIVDWDDSGAREAFENAKVRYWAEINGLPCDITLPDPDIYIDEVDCYAVIDPELVADLYRKPPPPPRYANKNEDLSYEAFLRSSMVNMPVEATGWGDAEEQGDRTESQPKWDAFIEKPVPATGWGDHEADHQPKNWNSSNLWNENGGWGDGNVGDGSWRDTGNNSSKDYQSKYGSQGRHRDNWNYEQGRRNGRKRYGYGSRFSKPRHQVNNFQPNTYEKTMHAAEPMVTGQWVPKAPCALMNGQRSGEVAWRWDKPVT